jgi:hypothetical protein
MGRPPHGLRFEVRRTFTYGKTTVPTLLTYELAHNNSQNNKTVLLQMGA